MTTTETNEGDAAAVRGRLATAITSGLPCSLRWTAADDGAGETRSCRVRPIRVDADELTAAVTTPLAVELLAAQLRGRRVMAIFRSDGRDLLFVTPIARVQSAGDDMPTVTLGVPAQLLETNRRTNVRVDVGTADADLVTARAWRIDDRCPLRDRPLASREMVCAVRDLSAGGGRFALYAKHRVGGSAPHVGDRLRIELTSAGAAMLFDGRARAVHAAAPEGPWLCGAEFALSRHDVEGRRDAERLAKLVATLQRRTFQRAAA